ncbi:MAG: hypothetical protein WC313_08175 [Candidatus Kapaibacterium sp.]
MNTENAARRSYYNLFKHNILQYLIFAASFAVIAVVVFETLLPFLQTVMVEEYLKGKVYNRGEEVAFTKELSQPAFATRYYTRWAIDIYIGTPQEARYWFNPFLSLFLPTTLFSFLLALMLTSNFPVKTGLLRQKIEREVMNVLDSWHFNIFGTYSDDDNKEFCNRILQADTKELLDLAEDWNIFSEDLQYLQKVLIWRESNFIFRMFNSWTSLKFYLRFYFTDKYSKVVLGLVYIGAAVLIIIIGMRGLKFIPSTEPSLVFFALGLEFSVLLTYAFTVMYSRADGESSTVHRNVQEQSSLLSDDFGNSKEVENLLRAFLSSRK